MGSFFSEVMNSVVIDKINIALILLSLIIAIYLPFELFLFAYAVLGPLHYLTEIRWLREKEYFLQQKKNIWFFVIASIYMSLHTLLALPFVQALMDQETLMTIENFCNRTNFPLPFVMFLFAIIHPYCSKISHSFLALFACIATSVFFTYYVPSVIIFMGMLLPTILHVYVFTLLFMVFGIKSTHKTPARIAVGLMCLVPLFIVVVPIGPQDYVLSTSIISTYLESNFPYVNAHIAKIFGQELQDTTMLLYSPLGLKIQIFVAFAYTYHYLNWFSKTSIIGWSKSITRQSLIAIIVIWIFSIGLYAYDYKTGLTALFFLSYLHVFLELPLNAKSLNHLFFSQRYTQKTPSR